MDLNSPLIADKNSTGFQEAQPCLFQVAKAARDIPGNNPMPMMGLKNPPRLCKSLAMVKLDPNMADEAVDLEKGSGPNSACIEIEMIVEIQD